MRELSKKETKAFESYFYGLCKGIREGYTGIDKQPNAWTSLGFFTKRKYQKDQFNDGYSYGHKIIVSHLDKEWSVVDPEIYKPWYKDQWLWKNYNKEGGKADAAGKLGHRKKA